MPRPRSRTRSNANQAMNDRYSAAAPLLDGEILLRHLKANCSTQTDDDPGNMPNENTAALRDNPSPANYEGRRQDAGQETSLDSLLAEADVPHASNEINGGDMPPPVSFAAAVEDCLTRFIHHLPISVLSQSMQLLFELQEAYWWYVDFWYDKHPAELEMLPMLEFGSRLIAASPVLMKAIGGESKLPDLYSAWRRYLRTIPLRGGILLNDKMDRTLMVQAWNGKVWMWPRGKQNEGESAARCAEREIEEEIGIRTHHLLDPSEYLDRSVAEQNVRFYVIPGISMEESFEPKGRKEIWRIRWISVYELPGWALPSSPIPGDTVKPRERGGGDGSQNTSPAFYPQPPGAAVPHRKKFFCVAEFVPALKRWINERKYALKQLGMPLIIPVHLTAEQQHLRQHVLSLLKVKLAEIAARRESKNRRSGIDVKAQRRDSVKQGKKAYPSTSAHTIFVHGGTEPMSTSDVDGGGLPLDHLQQEIQRLLFRCDITQQENCTEKNLLPPPEAPIAERAADPGIFSPPVSPLLLAENFTKDSGYDAPSWHDDNEVAGRRTKMESAASADASHRTERELPSEKKRRHRHRAREGLSQQAAADPIELVAGVGQEEAHDVRSAMTQTRSVAMRQRGSDACRVWGEDPPRGLPSDWPPLEVFTMLEQFDVIE